MPSFTFNCENVDDEPGCSHETEVDVSVSGGERQTWDHPGCASDVEYELPSKCEGCGHEFTQPHLDYMTKEINSKAEAKAVSDYEDAKAAYHEDRMDERRQSRRLGYGRGW